LNEYEKAFVKHIARLRITPGPHFALLSKEALEGEFGGEGDALLKGLSQPILEDPRKFASVLYRTYGTGALQYFTMIVKYAESGNFHPEQDEELEREEEELESVVQDVETNSEQEEQTDASSNP
jgi:hypothetical protein